MKNLTKQGVRNLDNLGPKRPPKRELPPIEFLCTHPQIPPVGAGYEDVCTKCGVLFDHRTGTEL